MNRIRMFASPLFVSLSLFIIAPQFAAAADGGGKTTIEITGPKSATTAVVVPIMTPAAPVAEACKKIDAELTQCRANLETCNKAQKELVDFVNKGCKGKSPLKPNAAAKANKPKDTSDDVVCVAPAIKVGIGRKQHCVCGEGEKDHEVFPARSVDEHAPAFGRKVEGVCVPSYELFRRTQAELEAAIAKLSAEKRVEPSQDMTALVLWYNSLIRTKDPLTPENWQAVFDRLNKIEGRVNALEKIVGDTVARVEILEKKVARFSDQIDLMFGARGGYNIRPGAGVESFALSIDVQLTFWVAGRHGFYVGGFVGPAWNSDVNRYSAGARVGYANALTENRSLVLRLGGVVGVEPAWVHNDSTTIAAEVGLDIRPGGGPFTIGLGVLAGANRVAIYRHVGGRVQRVGISESTSVFTPSILLGLTF